MAYIETLNEEQKAMLVARPEFNILYVGDEDSFLHPFRGEHVFKTFKEFYRKNAKVSVSTVNSSVFADMTTTDLRHYNVLWIDNVTYLPASQKAYSIHEYLTEQIKPGWRKDLEQIMKDGDTEKAIKLMADLNSERYNSKLRIIYQLDEFAWEGIVGRSKELRQVQVVESFITLADSVVVPTAELRETILHYGLGADQTKDIQVVPTSMSYEFVPLFKDTSKPQQQKVSQLLEKPRVLVKGLAIPENVDEFICENYKKFDITLSSVGEVSDHLKGLLSAGKVRHIYHWANPYVVSGNLYASWAMERDSAFDFTIITKPSELAGKLYEICLGDEDVLFAAASGSLPICGIADLDYEEGLHNVGTSCPNFGSANTAKELREAITSRQVWTRYKEDYGKVRAKVEARLTAGPFTMSRYFSILLGPEKSEFRNEYLEQKKKEAEEAEAQATESRIDNVVNVDFNKGTADA